MLATVWIAVIGCGEPSGEPTPDPPVEAQSSSLPGVDTMRVLMDEYSISMPVTIPEGAHPVRFVNAGFEEHNIFFRKKGSTTAAWVMERRLNPGERRVATVELEPGDYTAICDFSGHDGRGMFVDFTVEPAPRAADTPDSAGSAP